MYKPVAELLAPAGSYESIIAAIKAGADAVYVGGLRFGARAYANNLNEDELKRAMDYAHIHGKKLYLTVNTLLKEHELETQLYSYLRPLYEEGLDAVIIQDLGVLQFVREFFPALSIHGSTQMTLTGVYGAKFLKEQKADRIVTARELSLTEIRAIHKEEKDLEIESFIHGALCYCYSGQCLLSSMIGGRSGNRGRCAQPCRLPYQALKDEKYLSKKREPYLLSPKDLCTIEILPDILEAGVYSLKIEGRMKRPEYTAGVVSIYRKYLNLYEQYGKENYLVEPEDRQVLLDLYNRGGFTKGYYTRQNGRDMMFLEGKDSENGTNKEALFQEIRNTFIETELKEWIQGKVEIKCEKPSTLKLIWNDQSVTVLGETPQIAKNQPLQEEMIKKQLEKTGNTPFQFKELIIETDKKSYLSVTQLNDIRRKGLNALIAQKLFEWKRPSLPEQREKEQSLFEWMPVPKTESSVDSVFQVRAYLEKIEYFEPFLEIEGLDALYLASEIYPPSSLNILVKKAKSKKKNLIYVLPHILRSGALQWLEQNYKEIEQSGIAGIMLKNLDEFSFIKEKRRGQTGDFPEIYLDHTLYAYNTRAKLFFKNNLNKDNLNPVSFTLPLELNSKELKILSDLSSELLVYGYIPLMVSAQCTKKMLCWCSKKDGEDRADELQLVDRYQNVFPQKNFCSFCYNKLYNCKPLSLLTQKKEVIGINPGAIRMDFTIEPVRQAVFIAKQFICVLKEGKESAEEFKSFTRGHLKRGIE